MNREAKGGPRTRYQGSSIEQACAKSEGFMFQTGSSMVQVKFQADVSGLVMQALSSRAEEDVDSPSGMLTAPWKLRSLMAVSRSNLTTTMPRHHGSHRLCSCELSVTLHFTRLA